MNIIRCEVENNLSNHENSWNECMHYLTITLGRLWKN
jgi:hypothetical protein